MGNCERLKWNRKKLGLTQNELAKKVGLGVATIGRLEQDETRWEIISKETFDKISIFFEENSGWSFTRLCKDLNVYQPDNLLIHCNDMTENKIENIEESVEEIESETIEQLVEEVKLMNTKIEEKDTKTLTLMEFALEGLKESENHEEFLANAKLLKRILKDYFNKK